MSSAYRLDGAQPFETSHGSQSGFQAAVICFDGAVPVLLSDVTGGRQQFVKYPVSRRAWVRGINRGLNYTIWWPLQTQQIRQSNGGIPETPRWMMVPGLRRRERRFESCRGHVTELRPAD